MGQSSSSSRPPITHHNTTVHDDCGPSPTSNHPASLSMESTSNHAVNSVEVEAPVPTGPPRRSIRRSLLSFVKPSSRPSARETSLGSSTPNRRLLLNPRRWSRVSPALAEATDEATHTRNDGPSDIPSASIDRKGKGREEYAAGDAQDVHPSPPLNQQLTVSEPSASNSRIEQAVTSPALPVANETSVIPSVQQENNSQHIHQEPSEKQDPPPPPVDGGDEPAHDGLSTAAVTPTSGGQAQNIHEPPDNIASTAAPTSPAPATPRPLPPPGTLVVVQGVVHTTDVPRSNGQTTANGTNGDSVNHRMSMPPRPRSSDPTFSTGELHSTANAILSNGQQPDPGNFHTNETNNIGASSAYNRDRRSGDVSSLSSSNVIESATQPAPTGDSEQNTTQQNGSGEQRSANHLDNEDLGSPGSISSSSIDVLGTLLSVAAAATAASLLTGSSEPILPINHSSGLHSQANSPTTSPTSPGIPPDFSAASRAERMRNAWSSIRERLGIRSSNSPDTPISNNNAPAGSAVPGQPAAPDTREMMLSEMARAFSVGLGLGGFTGPAANTNNNVLNRTTEAPTTPEPRLPPVEGSFERFLVDLQADLRNALTTGEGGSGVRAMVAGVGWSDANSRELQTRQEVSGNGAENHPSDTAVRSETHSDNAVSARLATNESEHESDVTPSEGTVPEPLRQRTGGNREEGQPSEPSRINWWRLYRFPAIGVPRNNLSVSVAAAAALSTAGPTPAAIPRVDTSGVERPAPPSSVESPLTHPEPETRNVSDARSGNSVAPQDNTVVPVIIVGLQSVHMDLRHGGEHPEVDTNSTHNSDATGDQDEDIFGPVSDQDSNADALEQSAGPQVANAEGRRGTRWRSRAADAIRNLRPRRGGERNGDAAAPHLVQQMPPMGPGSRMFLIYVIGGYYPPNHSIVLGNPADLESFEALSELAELLGQVKPSTATREDIEKSGLQVIKSTQVRQYEREGKITNNCAERCLICLDDYLPEEDVRMMGCRHAFHKDCVDKWLQTGKNNCPACRSRGVSTDARSQFFS